MLKALNIRNFALVAALDVEFGPGLTVITGESGAGKSILLDALSLVLGARVRRGQLRPGASSCDVSAEFDLAGSPAVQRTLTELEMADANDPNVCLVRRTAAEGRSRAFVNGVPVALGTLRMLTEPLIDIHAQHEHRQLLVRDVQRSLLDDFGVAPELLREVGDAFRARTRLREALAEQQAAVAKAAERRELLRYQIDELGALGDSVHRVAELSAAYKRQTRAQEWTQTTGEAAERLQAELIDGTARLVGALEGIDDDHPGLKAAVELALSAEAHLTEALGELRRYQAALPEGGSELPELEAALSAIHDLARKHRVAAADLGAHLEGMQTEYERLAVAENRIGELAKRVATADSDYAAAGARLSGARQCAAEPFARQVEANVAKLGLPEAAFAVRFEPSESEAGLERVEFRMAANPGLPVRSLAEVASGGELSRFALAIEVVAAASSSLPCLILDEADIGVGGTTADVVGRMLKDLAKSTQVIAITHAPQVAALGDAHLRVAKTGAADTAIEALDEAARTDELARMLGGRSVTDESRSYARTLLADREAR